jgi:hypothetical protein
MHSASAAEGRAARYDRLLSGDVARLRRTLDPDAVARLRGARRVAACGEILMRMREEATRPGRTLADAFEDCTRFYREAGFAGEWERHHQGGLTGYASREVIATPSSDHVIGEGQAFAWNPSVVGAKAEETFVLTEAGADVVAGATAGAVL